MANVVRMVCVALLSVMGVMGLAAVHSAAMILAQPEMVLLVGLATTCLWCSAGHVLLSMSR